MTSRSEGCFGRCYARTILFSVTALCFYPFKAECAVAVSVFRLIKFKSSKIPEGLRQLPTRWAVYYTVQLLVSDFLHLNWVHFTLAQCSGSKARTSIFEIIILGRARGSGVSGMSSAGDGIIKWDNLKMLAFS